MEQTQEMKVDSKTGLDDYIEFGKDRIWIAIQNWRTIQEPNKKNPADKPFIKLKADVWKQGSSKDMLTVYADKPKVLETTHTDLRRKMNALLETRKPSELFLVGIKVVDDSKKPYVYDVETG